MIDYENHHRHSYWTNVRVSDSVVSNADYAARAVELGQHILSSCEHGWQGNYYDVWKLAKANNLKMLFASEAYWVKDRTEKDNSNCHIFLGARNENGRQALNDILSEANLTGFYGKPRVDVPLILSLPSDDVWVTTACIAGWRYDDVESIWEEMFHHFKKNFFLEVQYHNTPSQIQLNQRILRLHNRLKIPLIMGCDSHYIFAEDAQNRTDFLASKEIFYPEEEGWYLDMPDGNTAYERFAQQGVLDHSDIIDAISNTHVFRDVEEYDDTIFNSDIKMPSMYPDWTQEQRDAEYQRLVWAGWDAYKKDVPEERHEHYEAEIRNEIQTVLDTKMADYFIDNYHIIKKGKENGGHLTMTGRGSAVSFATNKMLGFTEVDRIAASVKMYPERFMSATRILQSGSLPDIDFNVDTPEPFALAQQEVLGEDHAYPMVAYGTQKISAAWKLYAKSQGIPFETANAVSDQLKKYDFAVKHAEEDETEDISPYDYIDKQYWDIFDKSEGYQGLVVSWSIAPCSYLLYQGSIRREIGLVRVKDHICCCMDGHWAEECHFLKNDILTVQVVNLIYKTFHRIGMEPPPVSDLLDWCNKDRKPWELYQKGCTLCLNQVEKTGTSARVGIYRPSNISELCAFVAAIRPGFKSMYKTFESRTPFSYGVKAFDEMIQTPEMPNSFVLYQEQEMEALHYAGIPMSECYTAVKNIAKKRKEKVLAYEEKFKAGFNKTMIEDEHRSPDEAERMSSQLWQIITDAASYSFNCLSGDTVIQKPGAKNGRYMPTVEEMYMIMTYPEYARAAKHMPLRKKYLRNGYGSALSMFEDGRIHKNKIVGIYPSGEQLTYLVKTKTGKSIKCTMGHSFPTPNGKKKLSELSVGDQLYCKGDYESCSCHKKEYYKHGRRKLYEKGIPTYLDEIVEITPLKVERTYDVEMADPAHTIVSENGLVASNCSHSYCVALDSLYEAWLKANHPLEFYETALKIYEKKGDKDKMNALKEEAENYFNIQFPPFRFGQDNREIRADIESHAIWNSLKSIKGFGSEAGQLLYECSQIPHKNFMSVLQWLDSHSMKSAKIIPLIKIDYFQDFGNNATLLRIIGIFDFLKQGQAKKIKKDKLNGNLLEFVSKYGTDKGSNGNKLLSYTITDMESLLDDLESYFHELNLPELDYRTKAENQKDVLGYVDLTTGREEDRRKLYILDVYALQNKWNKAGGIWKYKIKTKSVGSGKVSSLSLEPACMSKTPIKEGDIIYAENVRKDHKGYWNLLQYSLVI